MKIFILGPKEEYKDNNAEMFNKCENVLIDMGHNVFNPAWLKYGCEWRDIDKTSINLKALEYCDAVCCLPNWTLSDSAILENKFAKYQHKLFLFFDGEKVR